MLCGEDDEEELEETERDPVYSDACFKKLRELHNIKRRIDKVSACCCRCFDYTLFFTQLCSTAAVYAQLPE